MFVAFLGWGVHDEKLVRSERRDGGRGETASSAFEEEDPTNERRCGREDMGCEKVEVCTDGVVGKRNIVRSRRRFRCSRDGILGGDGSKTEVSRGSEGEGGDGWVGTEV